MGAIVNVIVIYESKKDRCWIAHSLQMDQIGTGSRPVEALADLLRAILQILELARTDETIQPFREAPHEIQEKLKPFCSPLGSG